MSLFTQLAGLALKGVGAAAAEFAGAGVAVDAATSLLTERFTDHSVKLVKALDAAHARAWRTVEVCLAGRSWWDSAKRVLDTGTDRAFRDQVQAFLDANPLDGIDGHGPDFRSQCLAQLASARKAGLLDKTRIDPAALAEKIGDLSRFGDAPAAIEAEYRVLQAISSGLRRDGYEALAAFLEMRPAGGPPLLVSAMRFHFQREVEQDAQLFQGLAYARLEALDAGQRHGLGELAEALDRHAEMLERMLADVHSVVVRTHGDVLDIKSELASQGQRMQELGHQVLRALEQRQLQGRELRGGDSLSIRDDDEKRLARDLVRRYRAMPADERLRMPALLNAVGKLEVASGEFEAAERDFREARGLVDEPKARAEVDHNAYRASLERRAWDDALHSLRAAATGDPARFAPFPLDKFAPERILGAGGFGVAILCRNRHTGGRVVIKTLHREGMARSVDELFREAQALEGLDHPAIIRVRDCDFADRVGARPYFVMDYFPPGQTLENLVAEAGPLKVDEVLPLARLVAEGLESAHMRGILHRDIKPGNILVRRGTAGMWECKLIDFGLAAPVDAAASTARSAMEKTLAGSSIAGTMDYAAPEQMGKLRGVAVGTWSDVYGWGKTACFALFGTPQPTFQHWQQIPGELADLLGRCLNEKPTARPQTFAQVLRELDSLMVAETVEEVIEVPMAQRAEPRREPRRELRREIPPEPVEEPALGRGNAGMVIALVVVGLVLAAVGGGIVLVRNIPAWQRPPLTGGFPNPFDSGLGPFTEKPFGPEEFPKVLEELRGKPQSKRLAQIAHQLALTEPTKEQKKRRHSKKQSDDILAVSKGLDLLLADANFHARKESILALRKWGTSENVPALVAILEKADEGGIVDFRVDVARTLAAIGDPRGIPAVAKRLTDSWDLRRGIIQVVQEFGPAAEDETIKYLDVREKSDTRKAAVIVLGQIGGKKSLDALRNMKEEKGLGRDLKPATDAIEGRQKK